MLIDVGHASVTCSVRLELSLYVILTEKYKPTPHLDAYILKQSI
jgi:hypothetical protein